MLATHYEVECQYHVIFGSLDDAVSLESLLLVSCKSLGEGQLT
jgi:hypothetical protein